MIDGADIAKSVEILKGSKIDFESFMDSSSRVIEGSMVDLVGYSKVVSVGSYGQSDCLDAGSGGVTGVSLTINVDDVLTRYSLSGDSIASVSGGLTQLVNQEGLGVSGLSFNWICLGGEREKVLVQLEQEFKNKQREIAKNFSADTKEGLEKQEELKNIYRSSKEELKSLQKLQIISEIEYFNLSTKYAQVFSAGIGAEAVRKILCDMDPKVEIETLKKLHNGEAEALERGILRPVGPSGFIGKIKFLALKLLGIKTAYAAGECYRDAGPNPIVGANTPTICCDCGIQRIGKIVFPVPDAVGCKTFGGQCNVANFGCLNGAGWGGNAIWDPASKICGYDAGGGFSFLGIIGKIFGVFGAVPGIIGNLPGLGDTNFTGGIIQNVPGVGSGTSFPTPIIKDLPSGPELINI